MNLPRITTCLGIGILCAMLLAILAVAISVVHSFDVFWQLQSGRYIWETKSMIHSDLFTLAADAPRSEHTWLHSLILFGLYSLGGYSLISLLKGLLITATFFCLIMVARMREASWPATLMLVPLFLLTSGGWLERPQIWTFLIFALFLLVLESFRKNKAWLVLWLFPLALFWANVHAGAVLAAAILAAYMVGGLGDRLLRRHQLPIDFGKLLTATGLVAVAAFMTPYPRLLTKTLLNVSKLGGSVDASGQSSAPLTQMFNMDWTLTTFAAEPVFFYTMGGVAAIAIFGWRRISLVDFCLLCGLALMGMKLVRHIPFFYMGTIAILPVYLDQMVEPVRLRLPELYRKIAMVAVCTLAVGSFWYLWQPVYKVYGVFNTGLREWHYPIEATEFVQEHKLARNIYNTYDWGGYMAFKLFPDYLVFWDGRQNSVEMFKLGWNVMAGKPNWEQILNKFSVKTIVTRASTIDTGQKYPLLDRLKMSPDWSLVFNTESSMVFVKRGSVSETWLKRYAKPKERMDDTILSEAHLMVNNNARRYMAWWEMAQIYTKRKQYQHALFALKMHLTYAPPGQQVAAAEKLYQSLSSQKLN